ncbi:MAG: SpoIID/LytB domain-containing protein [Thermoanaerobacteraceae bacterium]|nr:SpoIID/LytB domain-containing protein [Thermoanaerobacteraceae bacterium]
MRKYFLLYLCFIALIITPATVQSAELFPAEVRVGLYYDSSARNLYQLTSDNGFNVMINNGQENFTVMTFSDKLLKVYSTDLNAFSLISNDFKDKQGALEYASKLEQDGVETYLLFDGSWSVLAKTNEHKSSNSGTFLAVKGDTKLPGLLIPFKLQKPVIFTSTSPEGLIAIEGRRYRGMLEMTQAHGSNIQVVNELGLQEYLYGVVPKEITPSWHEEVLKAQAVAARTYTIVNLSKWEKYGFDVGAGTGDQVYGGYDAEHLRTNKAVDETAGQIILYNDKPIMAFYHADSGGRTETCEDVFSADLPYLQPVDDIFYANSPHSQWETTLTLKDISNRASSVLRNIGEIRQISIVERSQAGRVKKLLLKGSQGEAVLEKSQIRNILGLKSNYFDILGGNAISVVAVFGENIKENIQLESKSVITGQGQTIFSRGEAFILAADTSKIIKSQGLEDAYTFRGLGYGHGVGMSQWGAKAMAENGYNYVDILLHYYKNTQIKTLAENF